MKRVIFDIVFLLSVFALPWYITAFLGIVGLFIFKNYYEFIVAGAIIFAIFRVPGEKIIASPLWYSVIILILFLGIEQLKKFIILYRK